MKRVGTLLAAIAIASGCDCSGNKRGPTLGDAGQTVTFVEDFHDAGSVDPSQTTATIDRASGVARAEPLFAMETDVGDGGEGVFTYDAGPVNSSVMLTLSSGTHQFQAVELSGNLIVDTDGGVTLLVQGPLHLSGNAYLRSPSTLRIVVGGEVRLDCGNLVADGELTIHQLGDAGVILDCLPLTSEIFTLNRATGAGGSGRVEVWTRGTIEMPNEGYITSGRVNDLDASSGDVTLRAEGDVLIGVTGSDAGSAGNSYVIAGNNNVFGPSGNLEILSGGSLVLDTASYLIAGSGQGEQEGTNIVTRVHGDISLHNGSYYIAGSSGDITAIADGDLKLDDTSYILSGHDSTTRNQFTLRARSLQLTNSSYVIGTNTASGGATDISIEVTGNVTLDGGSGISGGPDNPGNAGCPDGGGGRVVLRAGGDVVAASDSPIAGGAGGTCTGGDLAVYADGAIGGPMQGGAGAVDGGTTLVSSAGLTIPPPDAGVSQFLQVVSSRIDGQGTVQSCGSDPAAFAGTLDFALDGGTGFTPASACVGKSLGSGFRYRATLLQQLFDGAAVKQISIQWR